MSIDPQSLSAALKAEAHRLGFQLAGIAPAVTPTGIHAFQNWLDAGYAGEMGYLERRRGAYDHPASVLPGVRSILMLGLNYGTEPPIPPDETTGRVSRYAWGTTDYHTLLRQRLKALARFLKTQHPTIQCRGIVDTAPLLERDFARLAGLGWFGKNTLLINRQQGSWMFLAALLLDFDLPADAPHETSHCGTCTRCLQACPTEAFEAAYVLDARRCISYLTIELKGPIPSDLRAGMGNWLFGCDVCQDVCPWNRKAPTSPEPAFQPQSTLRPANVRRLLRLSHEEFNQEFSGTPLERPGRTGILRNAAIVAGNNQDKDAIPELAALLTDPDPTLRGAAVWALQQMGSAELDPILQDLASRERDPSVLSELAVRHQTIIASTESPPDELHSSTR